MSKNKKGELSFISLLGLLFGSVLFVSAVVLNSTNNNSTDNSSVNITINDTLVNISLVNESIVGNLSITNNSIIENQTANLTLNQTIENLTLNQSTNLTLNGTIVNQTINLTLREKPIKNLTQIIERHKNKLNNETEKYLKSIKNKTEEGKYIIKFKNSIDENKLVNVTLDKKIDKFKVTKIKGKVEDIEDLIEDNEIEFLELEQNVEVLGENIPFNIKKIKADSVWNVSNGSGIKVAVLDTGISLHNDLSIAGGISFVDNNYFDSNGHGTSTAGVISALSNNKGLVGVSPSVDLYSVKIMQSSTGELSNAIAGIEWAINNSMDIVSMSFGFNSYSQIFKEVLQSAYNNNVLLVAASGNNGQDNILYPAKYDSVIAVGAIAENDNLASFSSYGFEQELVAPGVDINSTSLGNSYSISSGTSLAAPHVAGVAALIKSFNKSLTNEQIRAKLRNDALDLGTAGKDDLFGYGLVQVNLTTTNYTFIKETYYYEVYNITNYFKDPNNYDLWKAANGTVDDVDFAIGYYWIKIFRNDNQYKYLYKISENSTIKLLSASAVLHDDFKLDGSSTTDGKVWFGGVLKVHNNDQQAGLDAECFDYDSDLSGTPDFDECHYTNASTKTACSDFAFTFDETSSYRAFYQVCTAGGSGDICTQGGLSQNRTISNTSQQLFPRYAEVVSYHDCLNSNKIATSDSPSYYVFDQKQAACSGTSSYNIQGRGSITGNPPTDDWVNYGTTQSCPSGTVCNADLAGQIVSFRNQVVPNPCVSLCSGSIYAVSVDSKGRPRKDDIIKVNNLQNGTTNDNGEHKINFTNAACGLRYNISAYCSHNASKRCVPSQKQSSLDFQNDNDTVIFDCNVCVNSSDLFISLSDIKVNSLSGDTFQIKVNVHSENINSNVNITVKGQNKATGLIERENSTIIVIATTDTNVTAVVNLSIKDVDYLHVYVDPKNQVAEPKTNNYILRPFIRNPIKAYLEVKTGYPKADEVIESYLELFIDRQSSLSSNYLNIIIGKNSNTFKNTINTYTQDKNKLKNPYFFDVKSIKYNNNYIGYTPYIGVVGGFWNLDDGNRYVIAYGKDIDGDIAAVKKLISASSLFLTESTSYNERTAIIDNFDITGISVMDLFHSIENKPFYNNRGSNNFKAVVERILNDNNFEIAIKTVKTTNDNTTLRLKNVNSDFSANFRDAITNDSRPIVFSGGLFNDLFYWEKNSERLIKNLKEKGRDLWEIEITGGPTTDTNCQPSGIYNCPNYNYNDTRDYYWPALIAGIQKYSTQNSLQYVGHSNGCGVALAAINKYQTSGKNNAGYYFDTSTGIYQLMDLSSNAIDTFAGVGCPGALNGYSFFYDYFGRFGDRILTQIPEQHISAKKLGLVLSQFCRELDGNQRFNCEKTGVSLQDIKGDFTVSRNLLIDYLNNIKDKTNSPQVDNGLSIRKFKLYTNIKFGSVMKLRFNPNSSNEIQDIVVSQQDSQEISDTISSTNSIKLINNTDFYHGRVAFDDFRKDLEVFLNDK